MKDKKWTKKEILDAEITLRIGDFKNFGYAVRPTRKQVRTDMLKADWESLMLLYNPPPAWTCMYCGREIPEKEERTEFFNIGCALIPGTKIVEYWHEKCKK